MEKLRSTYVALGYAAVGFVLGLVSMMFFSGLSFSQVLLQALGKDSGAPLATGEKCAIEESELLTAASAERQKEEIFFISCGGIF